MSKHDLEYLWHYEKEISVFIKTPLVKLNSVVGINLEIEWKAKRGDAYKVSI